MSHVRHLYAGRLANENALFLSFLNWTGREHERKPRGSTNKRVRVRQRRLMLSAESHHRTYECYGTTTEEITCLGQQRTQDDNINTELIKWTQITTAFRINNSPCSSCLKLISDVTRMSSSMYDKEQDVYKTAYYFLMTPPPILHRVCIWKFMQSIQSSLVIFL